MGRLTANLTSGVKNGIIAKDIFYKIDERFFIWIS